MTPSDSPWVPADHDPQSNDFDRQRVPDDRPALEAFRVAEDYVLLKELDGDGAWLAYDPHAVPPCRE